MIPLARSLRFSWCAATLLLGSAAGSWSASATWTGLVDGNWTDAGNWNPSVPGSIIITNTNSDVATFNNNANTVITVDAIRNLTRLQFSTGAGAFTFNSGNFYFAAGSNNGTPTSIVLDRGVTANQVINSNINALRTADGANGFGFTNNSPTATLTLNGNITGNLFATATTTRLTLDGAGNGIINGVIADGTGALSVVKSGSGTWTFTGQNTYTGSTSLADGRLILDFRDAGAPANNIISSSSQLVLGLGSPALAGSRTFEIIGKANTANVQTFNGYSAGIGANHLNLSTSGITGSLTINLGLGTNSTSRGSGTSLDISTSSGVTINTTTANSVAGTLNGIVTLNGTDFAANNGSGQIVAFTNYVANTATTLNTTGNQVVDMSGGTDTTLTGTGQNVLAGLRFNDAAARTITLQHDARMLVLGGGAAAGPILVTANVGANLTKITGGLLAGISSRDLLVLQNNTLGDLQIDSRITSLNANSLAFTKSGEGTVILTSNNTYTSNTFINEGKVTITGDATTGNTQTLTTTAGSNVITGVDTTGLFIGQRVSGLNVSVTNAGALIASAVWITAIDSVAGTVTLSSVVPATVGADPVIPVAGSGDVIFGNSGALGTMVATNAVQIGAGAALQIGNGGTTGSLVAGQGITNNGTVIFNRSNTLTFANVITGSGGVTQAGTGTTVLEEDHTYTGATLVSSGTILIDGSASASAATVNSGGTLGGSGTIGSITLNANGSLAPGNGSLDTFSTNNGDLLWNGQASGSFAQLKFDLNTLNDSSDRLALGSGILDKGTGSFFKFDFLGTGGLGFTYTLIEFGSTDFNVADFSYTNLAAGLAGEFVLNANSLQFTVTAIPEPSTALLLAGGLMAVVLIRRRSA